MSKTKSKVPFILWLIDGLLKGSQQGDLKNLAILHPSKGLNCALIIQWRTLSKIDTENGEKLSEIVNLLQFRLFVHTIKTGNLGFANQFGRTNICTKHAFFNQAVSLISHNRRDGSDFAGFTKAKPDLRRIKIQRTLFVTFFVQ